MKEAVFLPKIFYTTIYMQNTLLGPSDYLAQECFMFHFSYPYAYEGRDKAVITELPTEHIPNIVILSSANITGSRCPKSIC